MDHRHPIFICGLRKAMVIPAKAGIQGGVWVAHMTRKHPHLPAAQFSSLGAPEATSMNDRCRRGSCSGISCACIDRPEAYPIESRNSNSGTTTTHIRRFQIALRRVWVIEMHRTR